MCLAWVRAQMVPCFEQGADDVDAFLAGRELPSVAARRESRRGFVAAAGGVIH